MAPIITIGYEGIYNTYNLDIELEMFDKIFAGYFFRRGICERILKCTQFQKKKIVRSAVAVGKESGISLDVFQTPFPFSCVVQKCFSAAFLNDGTFWKNKECIVYSTNCLKLAGFVEFIPLDISVWSKKV